MDYDKDKVDEIALALLFLTSFNDGYGTRDGRAWPGKCWIDCTKKDTLVIQRERPNRLLYPKRVRSFQKSCFIKPSE